MRSDTLALPYKVLAKPYMGYGDYLERPDHRLVTAADLDMIEALSGGARGYHTAQDIITQTADGRNLNDIWNELQQTIAIWNQRRQLIIDLLTFSVTNVIEDVPQVGGDDFEQASEFGEPKSIRGIATYFSLAYDFYWYDIAARFTWQFLADASSGQVEAAHQSILEADNRLLFKKVLSALFTNTNRSASIRQQAYTVYSLYNADGTVPPPYKGTTFSGSETHYLASGATAVDSGDVEALINKLAGKGYSVANGTQLILLVNSQESASIRTWRANVVNANAAVATYDFIPAQGQPPIIASVNGLIGGGQPAGTYQGLVVIGSYGPVLIVEEDYIPAGYMVIVGTGGAGGLNNPVGIREHANPGLRGLRLLPGNQNGYPLIESFYQRGFGTGIRQRGGAAVMKITAGAYSVPAAYNTP